MAQQSNNLLKFVKHFLLCVVSGMLLIFSFPQKGSSALIWIALVPFFYALEGKNKWKAFFLGYLTGLVFFGGTLFWFVHVSFLAAASIVAYLSFYFGVFAFFFSLFSGKSLFRKIFLLPAIWVALELFRAYFLTGFGWVSLGHSQYKNLVLIQIAEITGVYGVSFLIVMVNVFAAGVLSAFKEAQAKKNLSPKKKISVFKEFIRILREKKSARILVLVLTLFFLALTFGTARLVHVSEYLTDQEENGKNKIRVALIQANISQDVKWYEPAWDGIITRYIRMTNKAAERAPDLIIWPETAIPGIVGQEEEYFDRVSAFVDSLDIPLLAGTVIKEEDHYYNSAVLLNQKGEVSGIYRKIHLVPFGEYVPLRHFFPDLAQLVPIDDFTAGKEYTQFFLKGRENRFSVLICFEDTLSRLARKFAIKGAELFINITNDGWFGDTKAPFLHLQPAVFSAVENHRAVIQCANTGISAVIDATGKVCRYLQNGQGKKTFIDGYLTSEVIYNNEKTFYMRYGDFFGFVLMLYVLLEVIFYFISKKTGFN